MSAKTIHLIRHAQSEHNARVREVSDEDTVRYDPAMRDAPLTALGHAQAQALAEDMAALHELELVVTSPLTRAIQTMTHAFRGHRAPRVVERLHREHLDSFCDVGRAPAELARTFPALTFGHLNNPWWHTEPDHEGPFAREPMPVLQHRVQTFADWLAARPETTIAVIGHGTFLRMLTDVTFDNVQRVVIRL